MRPSTALDNLARRLALPLTGRISWLTLRRATPKIGDEFGLSHSKGRGEMAKDRCRRQSLITGVAVTAGGMLGITQPALADTFQVNASDDAGDGVCQDVTAGDCTLRDAVTAANDNTGVFDDITFASSIPGVTLGGSQINVTEGVYIQGNGPDATTIDGNNASGIFYLDP